MGFSYVGTPKKDVIITAVKGQEVSPELREEILKQTIYWSDDRLEHWFYDFKYQGQWITSQSINNELNEIVVRIF